MNILLLGKVPSVSERIAGELRAQGLSVRTSNDLAPGAAAAFEGRDFDLVAFGGGVTLELRDAVRRKFAAENPNLRFIDVFAPVAARQILHAIAPSRAAPVASGVEVVPSGGGYLLRLEAARACDLRVDLYHLRDSLEREPVGERHIPGGHYELPLEGARFRGADSVVLVTVDGDEFHPLRVERQ